MPVFIGASGWQYRSWKGPYYPTRLPQAAWLEHYAAGFSTVEVNNTFYRLPRPEVFASWAERTPEDFVLTIKASRYLTHVKRLKEPEEPVSRLMEGLVRLGPKLGPVLLQLPPDMAVRLDLLERTLAAFPPNLRLAVEPRHPSWFGDELHALLASRNVALVLADRRSRPITPLGRTAPWGYLRLHEGGGRAWPAYGRAALRSWAERLAGLWPPGEDADVYVYFNNDPRACAVHDAQWFHAEVLKAGLLPSRVPAPLVRPGPA